MHPGLQQGRSNVNSGREARTEVADGRSFVEVLLEADLRGEPEEAILRHFTLVEL